MDEVHELLAGRGLQIVEVALARRRSGGAGQFVTTLFLLSALVGLGYWAYNHILLAPTQDPSALWTPRVEPTDIAKASPGYRPTPSVAPSGTPSPVASATPAASPVATATATPEPILPWHQRKWEVTPGKGIENLVVLGDKELRQAITPGSQPARWEGPKGEMFALKLDAKGTVSRIRIEGMRALTKEGLYLGAPVDLVRQAHPEAEKVFDMATGQSHFLIDGLAIYFSGGKVNAFEVETKGIQGWRFVRLTIEPGKAVGPLILGEPVSEEALARLGEPEESKTRDRLVYRWGAGPRSLEAIGVRKGSKVRLELVVVRGLKVATTRGVGMGAPLAKVPRVYPEAQEGLTGKSNQKEWRIPGMFARGATTIEEFRVFPVSGL